tara:strand:- start:270 stop:911 length:642 start_codon:yes stop_codon:yes gene_type:complete
MGYLDNSSITVDAILTKHGRWKLAHSQALGIVKFALADDGINYNLWNPDHISGSTFYGEAIKNLPQMEAVPDDTNNMRYKLTTMDRSTVYMPYIEHNIAGGNTITLSQQSSRYTLAPTSVNFSQDEHYKFTIDDAAGLMKLSGQIIPQNHHGQTPQRADMPTAVVVKGKSLELVPRATDVDTITSITIEGVTSGTSQFVSVITKANILNAVKK